MQSKNQKGWVRVSEHHRCLVFRTNSLVASTEKVLLSSNLLCRVAQRYSRDSFNLHPAAAIGSLVLIPLATVRGRCVGGGFEHP